MSEVTLLQLSIYGSWDDTIGCYGLPIYGSDYLSHSFDNGEEGAGYDYKTCANNDPPMSFILEDKAEPGRVRVHAIYDGCWSFAISQVEEDEDVPDWAIPDKIEYEGYTQIITLMVPETVVCIWEVERHSQLKARR